MSGAQNLVTRGQTRKRKESIKTKHPVTLKSKQKSPSSAHLKQGNQFQTKMDGDFVFVAGAPANPQVERDEDKEDRKKSNAEAALKAKPIESGELKKYRGKDLDTFIAEHHHRFIIDEYEDEDSSDEEEDAEPITAEEAEIQLETVAAPEVAEIVTIETIKHEPPTEVDHDALAKCSECNQLGFEDINDVIKHVEEKHSLNDIEEDLFVCKHLTGWNCDFYNVEIEAFKEHLRGHDLIEKNELASILVGLESALKNHLKQDDKRNETTQELLERAIYMTKKKMEVEQNSFVKITGQMQDHLNAQCAKAQERHKEVEQMMASLSTGQTKIREHQHQHDELKELLELHIADTEAHRGEMQDIFNMIIKILVRIECKISEMNKQGENKQ